MENRRWLYRRIAQDALTISAATWLILFLMELVKPGIVSNYVSLTRAAAFVLFLAVCSLALGDKTPLVEAPAPSSAFWQKPWPLAALSAAAGLVVYLFMPPAPVYLTVLVVSVTVLCVWIGTQLSRKV